MTTIILFAPLVGAIIAGFFWRAIGDVAAQWVTTILLFLSCLLSWIIFFTLGQETTHVEIMRWIASGSLDTYWAIRLDRLTAIMLVVVTTVSAVVHLYSFGYMAHDAQFREGEESYRPRFFAYLSFFTFAMLMLVTADNLLQLFFGWEGVGVASYLLIGFYYRKPSANAAAIKAFIVNRIGDFGFLLGIFALFALTDSARLDVIFSEAPRLAQTSLHFLWTDWNAANLIAVLLFVGAMGKSAQLFLHTWLPDAMEGPTPVSALIHAATMVTAGVFLVCRMSPLFEVAPEAKAFVIVIGASTAFFAATIGLVQNDIKRVIAYSTCSQLGYMFVAAGSGVYGAAMFHLFTHAFFKAMLFLGAGSVIHAMHHEQDMRNYGGLRHKIPLTFWAMMIGTFAITGVGIPLTHIGFAGFLSKDAIIESAWATGMGYAFWMLVIAALFTSFYSWRLIFLTFYGQERGDQHAHEHAKESPTSMLVPLGVLALGATFAGMLWYAPFFGNHDRVTHFFALPEHQVSATEDGAADGEHAAAAESPAAEGDTVASAEGGEAPEAPAGDGEAGANAAGETGGHVATVPQGAITMIGGAEVLERAHEAPGWVKVSPFVAMLLGFLLAWQMYIRRPDWPARLAANQRPLYLFLLNKWYFDEIYDFLFIKPAQAIGRFMWKRGDGSVIDGTINGISMRLIPMFTRLVGRWQSGYLFTYAFAMVIGIALLLTWITLAGGAR